MNDLRKISIAFGLRPPEHEAAIFYHGHGHGAKEELPSTVELIAASRQHRWPKLRKLINNFFRDAMRLTTKYEMEMLRVLRLPRIEIVRRAEITNTDSDRGSRFKFGEKEKDAMEWIMYQWLSELVGEEKLVKQIAERPLYDEYLKLSYYVGANMTERQFRADYVAELNLAIESAIEAEASTYYQAMMEMAARRIVTTTAVDHFDLVYRMLVEMAEYSDYPADVARYLHRAIGEGAAWYWRRITYSEAGLAVNAARNDFMLRNNIQYVQWSAGAGACEVCSGLGGKVWLAFQSPEPVADTHPNCGCVLITLLGYPGQEIQSHWSMPSPYKTESRETYEKVRARLQTIAERHER